MPLPFRVQLLGLEKLPPPVVKVTVPVGVVEVPGEVSLTVAVQLLPVLLATTGVSQLTAVDVARLLTAWDAPALVLPLKLASPP